MSNSGESRVVVVRAARYPLCWLCNKRLTCGGWQFAVIGAEGHLRDVHKTCARNRGHKIIAESVGRAPKRGNEMVKGGGG